MTYAEFLFDSAVSQHDAYHGGVYLTHLRGFAHSGCHELDNQYNILHQVIMVILMSTSSCRACKKK